MSQAQVRRLASGIGKFLTAIVAGVATGVLVLSLSMIARDAMAASHPISAQEVGK